MTYSDSMPPGAVDCGQTKRCPLRDIRQCPITFHLHDMWSRRLLLKRKDSLNGVTSLLSTSYGLRTRQVNTLRLHANTPLSLLYRRLSLLTPLPQASSRSDAMSLSVCRVPRPRCVEASPPKTDFKLHPFSWGISFQDFSRSLFVRCVSFPRSCSQRTSSLSWLTLTVHRSSMDLSQGSLSAQQLFLF